MGTIIPAKDIGYWFDYDKELFVYKKDNKYVDENNNKIKPDIKGFLEVKQNTDGNFVIQYQYIDFKDKTLENLKKQLIEFKYNKLWIVDDKFIIKKDTTYKESSDGKMYTNSNINIIKDGLEVKYDYKNKVFVVTKYNHTIFGKNIIELKRNLNKFIKLYERIKKIFEDKTRLLKDISDIEINAIELNPEIFEKIPMSLKNKKRVITIIHEHKEKKDFELRKAEIEEMYKKYNEQNIPNKTFLQKNKHFNTARKLQKLCTIEDTVTGPDDVNKSYIKKGTRRISIHNKYKIIPACKEMFDTSYLPPRSIKK